MIKRLLLAISLMALLSGCSTVGAFYQSNTPGLMSIPGGGVVQLFYSNPNATDIPESSTATDTLGKRAGLPFITGGIGIMAAWPF